MSFCRRKLFLWLRQPAFMAVRFGKFSTICLLGPGCPEICSDSSIVRVVSSGVLRWCTTPWGYIGVGSTHRPCHHLCMFCLSHVLCSCTCAGDIRSCTRASVNSCPACTPYQLLKVCWYIKVNIPQSVPLVCRGSLGVCVQIRSGARNFNIRCFTTV